MMELHRMVGVPWPQDDFPPPDPKDAPPPEPKEPPVPPPPPSPPPKEGTFGSGDGWG